jgi:XTP/dITP diphosphohydrolase
MKLCFATNNEHKIAEVAHAVQGKFTLVSLSELNCFEELPETQPTIEGNSLQKAEFIFSRYNIPCFADDTGLEVESLNHAPGVFSARYAGDHKSTEDNINVLLKNLAGIKNRAARFRTVITLMGLNGTHTFEGVIEGTILTQKRGELGFGYDPIFLPSGYSRTLAEMQLTEKNKISHRAIAVQKLVAFLRDYPVAVGN